jgi:hypothetical protein
VFGEPPPALPSEPSVVGIKPVRDQGVVERKPRIPLASYVLGGTSVLAFGAFAYLRFSGINDYNRLNAECSPTCDQADVDKIHSKFTLSYLPLGIGIAALGGATAVYVFGRDSTGEPDREVSFTPIVGGAGAQLRTRF